MDSPASSSSAPVDACDLTTKHCIPCSGGVPALSSEEIDRLMTSLSGWGVVEGHHLEKDWTFDDFKQALRFTNQVGELAESEGHHPDIHLAWGKVKLTIWTHKIDGLTESDFILAAKVDQLGSAGTGSRVHGR